MIDQPSKLKARLQLAAVVLGALFAAFALSSPVWDRASRNDLHIVFPVTAACLLIVAAIYAAWKSRYASLLHAVGARFVLLAGFAIPLLWGRLLAGQIDAPPAAAFLICSLFAVIYALLYWLADVERVFFAPRWVIVATVLLVIVLLGLPGILRSVPLTRQADVMGFGYIVASLLWLVLAGYGFWMARSRKPT